MYQCYDFFVEHWNFQYIEYVCFQSHLLDQICHFHWTLVATGRDDWLQIMADWLQIMAVLWRSARSRSRCLLQTKMMSWFHCLLVLVMLWITHELLKWPVPVATKVFFPNSNSFGVVRSSGIVTVSGISFGLSMVLWGRSVGCQKVPRKVPPKLRQG